MLRLIHSWNVFGVLVGALLVLNGAGNRADAGHSDGSAYQGYDLVSYFDAHGPVVGSSKHTVEYQGHTLYFSSAKNAEKFSQSPDTYLPQYGGNCAFGMAHGMLSDVDMRAYAIEDGKLYLLINQATMSMWEQDQKTYIPRANKAWSKFNAKY